MLTKTKIMISCAATVAVLGGMGATLAYAGPTPGPTPGSPTASPSKDADRSGTKDKGERRGLLRRALHGEVTLVGNKYHLVTLQRGSVTQLSDSAIAVRSEDGFSATYELSADLRVRQDRDDATLDDVKVGTMVRVLATKQDSTLTARRIVLLG